MRAAVTYMPTILADIKHNLDTAESYTEKASKDGAEIIIFPEFFTTGFALHTDLLKAIPASNGVKEKMTQMSQKYDIVIGGSYLHYDKQKENVFNTYGLFFPSGEIYEHSKDIPTGLESFCYAPGDNVSAFETPLGRIGLVMCWEQLRWQTVRRMSGKVDLIVGGSCWWNFAPEDGMAYDLHDINQKLAQQAPTQLATIMGVPVLHASHCATFTGGTLTNIQTGCQRTIEGHAEAIDAYGKKVSKEMNAPGYQLVEITPGCVKQHVDIPEDKIWIPELPAALEQGFYQLNQQYSKFYQEKVKIILAPSLP
jgi:predicted amidohydrolase